MLDGWLKRRLRRHKLSEEANNIEWENRREVKFLHAEVERLKTELETKYVEMQSIKDTEDLVNQGKSGDSTTISMELSARVLELEQQIVDLKAELQHKDAELESFEGADTLVASRDLLSLDEDDGRIITNTGF
jgi:hypothetical protein